MKKLNSDDLAFVAAYQHSVADAPREEVLRYLSADSEVRSSHAFYSSMEYYTSIADAHGVWHCALAHAQKTNKGLTVAQLSAQLAKLPPDLPVMIYDAGNRSRLIMVDDSFAYDEGFSFVDLNTDTDS
jgi:hypothetical protein